MIAYVAVWVWAAVLIAAAVRQTQHAERALAELERIAEREEGDR